LVKNVSVHLGNRTKLDYDYSDINKFSSIYVTIYDLVLNF